MCGREAMRALKASGDNGKDYSGKSNGENAEN